MSRHLIMPVMGLCFCVTSSFADIQIFNGPKNPVLSAEKKEFQKEVEKQFERWVQVKATHYKKIEFQKFAKRFLGAKNEKARFQVFSNEFHRHMIFLEEERRCLFWAASLLGWEAIFNLDPRMRDILLQQIYHSLRRGEPWDELTRGQYQNLWAIVLDGQNPLSEKILHYALQIRDSHWFHALHSMDNLRPLFWVYQQYENEAQTGKYQDPLAASESLWRQAMMRMLTVKEGMFTLAQSRLYSRLAVLVNSFDTTLAVKMAQFEVIQHIAKSHRRYEQTMESFLKSDCPHVRMSALVALEEIVGKGSPRYMRYLEEVIYFTDQRMYLIGSQPGTFQLSYEALENLMYDEMGLRRALQNIILSQMIHRPAADAEPAKDPCEIIILYPANEPKN